MSNEQLKDFLEKVKGDLNLQERLKAAKSQDEVVSIAKEHGHHFGTEHISQFSEKELEGVAGGTLPLPSWKSQQPGAMCVYLLNPKLTQC